MSNSVDRRMLLRGAGVAGASLAGVAATSEVASAHGGHHDAEHGILGAWRITHTDDPPSGAVGDSIVTFSAGGVLTTEELTDGTLGLGAWRSDGHHFRARFFETQTGGPSEPTVNVEIRPRGHVHHDHIAGTYSVTIRTTDGKVVGTVTGHFAGSRIRA